MSWKGRPDWMWTSTTRTRSSLRAVSQDVMVPGTIGTSSGNPLGREVPKSNSRNTSGVTRVSTITPHRTTSNQRLAIISQPPRKDLISYYLSHAIVQGGVACTGVISYLAVDSALLDTPPYVRTYHFGPYLPADPKGCARGESAVSWSRHLSEVSGEHNSVSYTHLRAHETRHDLVCRLLLEKK